jgi:hypothetical protein
LFELGRGLHTVGLWLRHDPGREIGTTLDHDGRFLRLLRAEKGLMFAVDTTTGRGGIVAHLRRVRPEDTAECSIGVCHHEYEDIPQADGGYIRESFVASVREVSLVPSASLPGTWVR